MSERNDPDREALYKIIEEHVARLSEHFDAVQIFTSSVEQGGENTVSFTSGAGNWHARHNQAREWVDYHDEKNRERARIDYGGDSDCE